MQIRVIFPVVKIDTLNLRFGPAMSVRKRELSFRVSEQILFFNQLKIKDSRD